MGKGSRSRVTDRAAYRRNYERVFGMNSKRKTLRKASENATDVSDKPPPPGSPEAVAADCLCPRSDNHNGHGSDWGPNTYWMNANCPLHGSGMVARLLDAVGPRKPNAIKGAHKRRAD